MNIGSRRAIDSLIEQQRVSIDGVPAQLGAMVTLEQKVEVDGQHVFLKGSEDQPIKVLKYHKPINTLCSRNDPEGRLTIFEQLPHLKDGRWISIGRLDFKTTGLLLLTNNGKLAHKMMHPSTELEREYHVKVEGRCTPSMLDQLREGVLLEDGWARVEEALLLDGKASQQHTWVAVILKEGRNREVRRLFEAVGTFVLKLTRVRYGTIGLPLNLLPGESVLLTDRELNVLLKEVGTLDK
jgi:23S rRNA pseudouridine2605 synthase